MKSAVDPRILMLKQAEEKLRGLLMLLNTEQAKCGHCDMTRYKNFSEAQLHKEMTAVCAKLRKWAGSNVFDAAIQTSEEGATTT